MTVGDIRYCFAQLRNAGDSLRSDFVLYTGQVAGEFALSYLIETSNSMRKRRRKSRDKCDNGHPDLDENDIDDLFLPESQIPSTRRLRSDDVVDRNFVDI